MRPGPRTESGIATGWNSMMKVRLLALYWNWTAQNVVIDPIPRSGLSKSLLSDTPIFLSMEQEERLRLLGSLGYSVIRWHKFKILHGNITPLTKARKRSKPVSSDYEEIEHRYGYP